MSTLNFFYDELRDVMTIEGMKYSGDLFRAFADGGLDLYSPFDFIERKDHVVVIRRLVPFAKYSGRKDLRWHIRNFLIHCGTWLLYRIAFYREANENRED